MRIAHNKCWSCGTEWHKRYRGGDPMDPWSFGIPVHCPKCGHNYSTWLNYPPEEEENTCRICAQYAQENLRQP